MKVQGSEDQAYAVALLALIPAKQKRVREDSTAEPVVRPVGNELPVGHAKRRGEAVLGLDGIHPGGNGGEHAGGRAKNVEDVIHVVDAEGEQGAAELGLPLPAPGHRVVVGLPAPGRLGGDEGGGARDTRVAEETKLPRA